MASRIALTARAIISVAAGRRAHDPASGLQADAWKMRLALPRSAVPMRARGRLRTCA